jgi:hypothetical protein
LKYFIVVLLSNRFKNYIWGSIMKKAILASIMAILIMSPALSIAGKKGKAGKCIEGNCMDGSGTKVWSDGKKYAGSWKNGKRHGKGTMTHPDGNEQKGNWKNGKFIGN